jgi:hypothetical protein
MNLSLTRHISLTMILLPIICSAQASQPELEINVTYRQLIVTTVNQLLKADYIFPDVANQAATAVSSHLQSGDYDTITSAAAFADRLTQDYNIVARLLGDRTRVEFALLQAIQSFSCRAPHSVY